jgi:hypothetical protein
MGLFCLNPPLISPVRGHNFPMEGGAKGDCLQDRVRNVFLITLVLPVVGDPVNRSRSPA